MPNNILESDTIFGTLLPMQSFRAQRAPIIACSSLMQTVALISQRMIHDVLRNTLHEVLHMQYMCVAHVILHVALHHTTYCTIHRLPINTT